MKTGKTRLTGKTIKPTETAKTLKSIKTMKTTKADEEVKRGRPGRTDKAKKTAGTAKTGKATGTVKTIGREEILRALVETLKPLGYVYAMWEGGAIGWGRLDKWSDIDLYVDAEDERIQEVFPVVEQALESLCPIALKYEVATTPSQGYAQAFYRLRDTSEFLLIDLAVIKHSSEEKFLEPETHGQALFCFNKKNTVKCSSLDRQKLLANLKTRVERIKKRFETFRCFIPKEINRKNYIDALDLYRGLILDSLVEILRIRYKPVHHAFKTRYIHYHLPADVVRRLQDLYFVKSERDLEKKHRVAERWFHEAVKGIDFDDIARRLGVPG